MSLQVWLPLNGDLHNQGLNNVTPVLMGSGVTYTSGKIGLAATFPNNCNSCIHMPGLKLQTGSWAAWIKVNGSGSGTSQRLICEGRDTGSIGTNIWASKEGTTLYWRTHKIGGQTTISLNTWYHIALTFGNNIAKFYLNGVLLTSQPYTEDTDYAQSNDRFVLGKMAYSYTSTSSYFPFNGQLNDVRIYNHVLSEKEVEEIAKGLVLHYKLDNNGLGNPNLVPCGGTYTELSPWTTTFNNVDGNKWVTNSAFEGIPGKTYTISVRCDGTLASTHGQSTSPSVKSWSFWLYVCNSNTTKSWQTGAYDSPINLTSANHNYRKIGDTHVWTYTLSSTQKYISLRTNSYSNGTDNVTIKWWNMKVEEGDTFTVWTPYIAEQSNIVYDSSGYGNNGIITGDIQIDTNTSKYKTSIKKINRQYIRIDKRPAECMPKDAITVNIWQYATTWYNPISCTEGGGWNFENNNGIRFPVYISGVGYKVAQSSITPASTLNAWHMLTGTMDKNNIKIYYDGQEVGTIATGSTNGIGYANNYIFIGGEARGNQLTPASSAYVGNLSDVRIYATALTSEQILELYHTSGTIDNKGNIYSREYIEDEKISITKTGQFQANKIYDNDNLTKASILKNEKQIQGLTIYEY